jgi:uncharacterized membrane-anchored protein
LVSL